MTIDWRDIARVRRCDGSPDVEAPSRLTDWLAHTGTLVLCAGEFAAFDSGIVALLVLALCSTARIGRAGEQDERTRRRDLALLWHVDRATNLGSLTRHQRGFRSHVIGWGEVLFGERGVRS